MLRVAAMYNVLAILSMADNYGLSCLYAESVECISNAGSVWYVWYMHGLYGLCTICMVCMVCMVYGLYGMLEFKLCCEMLLLLNMVDMD